MLKKFKRKRERDGAREKKRLIQRYTERLRTKKDSALACVCVCV